MRSVWLTISLVLCGAVAVGCWWLWKATSIQTPPWTGSQSTGSAEPPSGKTATFGLGSSAAQKAAKTRMTKPEIRMNDE